MNDQTPPPAQALERRWALSRPQLILLATVLLAIAFAILGNEVGDGETHRFDQSLLHLAKDLRAGHPWLGQIMRDISGMGSVLSLTLMTVGTCGYLVLCGRCWRALLIGASIGSASILVVVLKSLFGRLRPDLAYAELAQSGLSFPSGHASMSAVVFLTLGALLADTHERTGERVYIVCTAVSLALMIGVSRVALGVHWATDVLGGWTFGTAWAIGWLLVAHTGRARRAQVSASA